ncbi:carbohydrate sulfotransferase 11-like isoform X2 [Penaeus vannamei]|uniref:carbohydrate sulfotransferase 11-like isoform X2 n=1 Tax=Penaeus vannamei TaxID=6689 RepID=UPI00387F5E37
MGSHGAGKGRLGFVVLVLALAVALHFSRSGLRALKEQVAGGAASPSLSTSSPGPAAAGEPLDPTAALHQLFLERRTHLRDRCRHLNVTDQLHKTAWPDYLTAKAPGPLLVCAPPKAGSTSWWALNRRLSRGHVPNPRSASAILVRHPLSRLTSGYRDKFLDGAPVGVYDAAWRTRTGSRTSWLDRWHVFWLPALISSGRVAPTEEFLRLVRRDVQAFEFVSENHVVQDDRVVVTKKHHFAEEGISAGLSMVAKGRQFGLFDATVVAYSSLNESLVAKYGNSSFTFREFLEFIVWSRDLGVLDGHWSPIAELCAPCEKDYQYILHLETVEEEAGVLLRDVGYPEEFRIETKHRTKGLTRTVHPDDLHYYKGLPKRLLKEILHIYEFDFDIFGYNAHITEDFD